MVFVIVLLSFTWTGESLFARWAVDKAVAAGGDTDTLISIIVMWLGIFVFISILRAIQTWFRWEMARTLVVNARESYYQHLLSLDINFFTSRKTGELSKRIDNASEAAHELLFHSMLDITAQLLQTFIYIVISFTVSVKMTLVILCALPFFTLLAFVYAAFVGQHVKKVHVFWLSSMARASDVIMNIFTVKSSAQESAELQRMKNIHKEAEDSLLKISTRWAILEGLGIFFLMRIILAASGLWFYSKGELTLGSYLFFLFAVYRILAPFEMLSKQMPTWTEKMSKVQLGEDLFKESIAIANQKNAKTLPSLKGLIDVSSISFSYEQRTTLDNISFTINPGEHVALVGHSGAGKTTIAMLLNRFYDVSAGTITIDEYSLQDLDVHWWRKQIGFVQQENIMFNDTVKENIRYTRPDASDKEVIEAAKRASADEFITDLPEGYDSLIGERGIKLSGGQRQRVAIARAILKDPSIVILDEATSALDSVTERQVQKGIAELMAGKTSLVIAHRLSTVESVDKIVVLDEGKLIAFGTHKALMKDCDTYREMVELQQYGLLAE